MVAETRRIKKSYGNRKLVLPPAHAQPSASVWWFTDHTPPHLQALDDSQQHLPLPLLGSFNSSYPTISNTFPRLIPLVKEVIAYLYNSTYNKCLCIISLLQVFCNIVADKYSKCLILQVQPESWSSKFLEHVGEPKRKFYVPSLCSWSIPQLNILPPFI